jgi:hypothetical protein
MPSYMSDPLPSAPDDMAQRPVTTASAVTAGGSRPGTAASENKPGTATSVDQPGTGEAVDAVGDGVAGEEEGGGGQVEEAPAAGDEFIPECASLPHSVVPVLLISRIHCLYMFFFSYAVNLLSR